MPDPLAIDLSYVDQLARASALIEARQPLPHELGSWALEQLRRPVVAAYRRERRDQHLRQAGEIIGGSTNARVRAILQEVTQLERRWTQRSTSEPEPGTVRGAVHRARLLGEIPARRQLYSILQADVQSRL